MSDITAVSEEWLRSLTITNYFKEIQRGVPTKYVNVQCADGIAKTTMRHLQYAWAYFQINQRYNVPIICAQIPAPTMVPVPKTHFIYLRIATKHVYESLDGAETLDVISREGIHAIAAQINTGINQLEHYAPSLDAEDYAELIMDPTVKAIREEMIHTVETAATKGEKGAAFTTAYNKFFDFADNEGLEKYRHNGLIQLLNSGTVKRVQVQQGLIGVGFASEVNSEFFARPITQSYALGLTRPSEWLANARSASKALMYQDDPMKETEYLHRLVQMTASCFKRLYVGNCGSKRTYPFLVTKRYAPRTVGKYHIENGELKVITQENYKENIGKTLHMRFVGGCNVPDHYGVCLCCAGQAGHAIGNFNVGHTAATRVYGAGSQNVLSVKHSDMTSVGSGIQLTDGISRYLHVMDDGFDIGLNDRNVTLIVQAMKPKDKKVIQATKIHNVHNLTDQQLDDVDIGDFSQFNQIEIEPHEFTGEIHKGFISQNQEDLLNFTTDMLRYIRDNPDMVELAPRRQRSRYYFINMEKFPKDKGVFRARFAHLDTLTTFGILQDYIKKQPSPTSITLAGQRTFGHAAEALLNIVNDSLGINLSLIELSIYAHTVHDPDSGDYRPSRQGNECRFETMDTLFNKRSLATKLISERITEVMVGPELFSQKQRVPGLYDLLLAD